jgi:chitin disaccharide deacetylase
MDQVKLIINGDDFGKSTAVNEAVILAYKAGTLTSCSLMVTGEAFDGAVRLARQHDGLAVGLHLVTVQGKAVLPAEEIPSLVDKDGHFPDSPTHAGLKYYFSSSARKQLARELTAQFERFHATGLKLSHVDSHLHMHVHPVIFAVALELAESQGIRRMRVPQDDFRLAARFHKQDLAGKAAAALIFGMLTRRMKKQLVNRGFSFPERVYGHFLSGAMTLEYVLLVLDHLSARTNELYFHPELSGGGACSGTDQQPGMREIEVLTSSVLRDRLQNSAIALTNYFGLVANA